MITKSQIKKKTANCEHYWQINIEENFEIGDTVTIFCIKCGKSKTKKTGQKSITEKEIKKAVKWLIKTKER